MTIDPNIKGKTRRDLEENIGENSSRSYGRKRFFFFAQHPTITNYKRKKLINGVSSNLNLCSSKDTIKKLKRQATDK